MTSGAPLSHHADTREQVPVAQMLPTIVQWVLSRSARGSVRGVSTMYMTLVPQHLGTVHLTLATNTSGDLRVRMSSSSAQASVVLQSDLTQLRNQLQKSGYASVQIDVFTQGQGGQQGTEQQRASTPVPRATAPQQFAATAAVTPVSQRPVSWLERGPDGNFYAEA